MSSGVINFNNQNAKLSVTPLGAEVSLQFEHDEVATDQQIMFDINRAREDEVNNLVLTDENIFRVTADGEVTVTGNLTVTGGNIKGLVEPTGTITTDLNSSANITASRIITTNTNRHQSCHYRVSR